MMTSIEINENNIFARYHKFIYGNLPDNFCAFFWQSLSAVLLFPFVIPSEIQNNYFNGGRVNRNFIIKIFVSLLIYFGALLVTGLGSNILDKIWGQDVLMGWNLGGWLLLIALVVGILVIIGIILTVVITLTMCSYLHEQIKSKKRERKIVQVEKGPSQFKLMIDNIRSKYCTKIVWKKVE